MRNFEEHFFVYDRIRHLPAVREVAAFNGITTKAKALGKQGAVPSRGIKRGSYYGSDAALARLARVPKLRVIVVLQDPTLHAEKMYFANVEVLIRSPAAEDALPGLPAISDCLQQPHTKLHCKNVNDI